MTKEILQSWCQDNIITDTGKIKRLHRGAARYKKHILIFNMIDFIVDIPELTITQKVKALLFGYLQPPKCYCKNDIKYSHYTKYPYGQYCSLKCKSNSSEVKDKIHNTKISNIDEYGMNSIQRGTQRACKTKLETIDENGNNINQATAIKTKNTKSKIDKITGLNQYQTALESTRAHRELVGIWIPVDKKELGYWDYYSYKVRQLTEINFRKNYYTINPNNLNRSKYHLDHIVSVKDCFINNIPIHIAAHQNNLQMLEAFKNLSKGSKSWMSVEKLVNMIADVECTEENPEDCY